jgi:hypothetical protein
MLKTYVKKTNQIFQVSHPHMIGVFFYRELIYVTKWIIDKNEVQQPNLNISGFH